MAKRTGKDSLAARRKGSMPRGNIDWKNIPANACIEDRTTYYVAHVGKTKKLVFWGSQYAGQALTDLARRSRRGGGCKR